MQRDNFKNWLLKAKEYDLNTANSRIGNCSTIEQAYGNLDEHYENDRLNHVSKLLQYSKQDERNATPPHPPLVIEGNVYDGLATLRQGINRYIEFKSFEMNREDNTINELVTSESINISSVPPIENNNKKQNTLLLLPIKDLRDKTFVIGGYQRGYKWGKKEILELLNDIDSYDSSKGLYCLQPLILKPLDGLQQTIAIGNKTYHLFKNNEVVDGQQRSTTLYLILKYLHHKGWIDAKFLYEIDFQTRVRSGVFLKNNLQLIYDFSIEDITENELIEKQYHELKNVNILWETFIDKHPDFNNVDVYHFFVVSCYLIRWIDIFLTDESKRNEFIEKLLENVKVIWYSLDYSQKDNQIIKVFLNNNKGKIGLTSSELIKALFILDIKNNQPESISNLQINQFALEWDAVEKQLQDDSFWYFIQPDENKYQQGTRIDYLFDLLLKKPDNSDYFFSYRHFETLFNKQETILQSWDHVTQLYYKLLNWYQDSVIFHYVGFLTNSRIKTLQKLLDENQGKSKDELKTALKKNIKKQFETTGKTEDGKEFFIYSKENLHYENYYSETLKVLLLYNVCYYLDNMAGHKFPFELFVKEKWSIEHIIPQNPKDIEDIVIYYQWFKDIIAYGHLEINPEIIEKIKIYNSIAELKKDKELCAHLDKIITESSDVTHSLSNLLLLDRNTNSALGNKLFAEKRNKILKFDKESYTDKGKAVFIPSETLNAFNKTFSTTINIENWTKDDGDNYLAAIEERLKDFLPKA